MGLDDFFIHEISKGIELRLPFHAHRKSVNDFIFITDGYAIRTAGLDEYRVSKGMIFLTTPDQIRTTQKISQNVKGFYGHFSNAFLGASDLLNKTHAAILKNPLVKLTDVEIDRLKTLMLRMLEIQNHENNIALIQPYLVVFLTELRFIVPAPGVTILSRTQQLYSQFRELLSLNIYKSQKVAFYADKMNITPNHLNKISKAITGKSTSSIIQEWLILESKVLLYQRDLPIAEIAFALGFEDPSYFGRFFKKHTGKTPTDFMEND